MKKYLIAYVDETGDTGDASKKGASSHYALGCVILDSSDWSVAFDKLVSMRRWISATYGIPTRAEIKANYLIRGNGPLRDLGLSLPQRKSIYEHHLHHLTAIKSRAFSVVIDKQRHNVHGQACLELAWETLLQRLERTSASEGFNFAIHHDAGENDAIRKLVRRSRRFLTAGSNTQYGVGSRQFQVKQLIDDPVPKDSSQSYFIQLADLVAYAGWRWVVAPGSNIQRIVPQSTWGQIGGARLTKVNMYQHGDGVVRR